MTYYMQARSDAHVYTIPAFQFVDETVSTVDAIPVCMYVCMYVYMYVTVSTVDAIPVCMCVGLSRAIRLY